jgi:8-oxo-dGTP pyrophosphatase MutT (NUDIX family)
LTRDSLDRLQVYLLRRSLKSGFMPGSYVFPGGTVDPHDRIPGFWENHVDLGAEEIRNRFGGTLSWEDALAHGITAVRETFEEAGVFLGGTGGARSSGLQEWLRRRGKERLQEKWFREIVEREGLTLRLSGLCPWSHWITPAARSKRYDTRFYVSSLPEAQECAPDCRETTHGLWITPQEGLEGNFRGEIPLSPPALVTLHELLPYRSRTDLSMPPHEGKASSPWGLWGEARLPRLVMDEGKRMLLLPWDPDYQEGPSLTALDWKKKVLSPGDPFSRLCLQGGIWKPVEI